MEFTVALILLAGFVFVWAYGVYVKIIRKRNRVQESYSGIDVQLKKRHDLIPNMLTVAKKFMKHEKDLFESITALRSKAVKSSNPKDAKSVERAIEAELGLTGKLNELMISVENYPQLKSDQTMLKAQDALHDVEEHIAAARRFYNTSVRQLNDIVQIWPMSWIASIAKVAAYPFFEADDSERVNPDAEKLLS